MSEMINLEVKFFVVSLAWGLVLLVIYDILRILRRLLKHSVWIVSIEDLVFWIVSGILIFKMMYEQNNGIIRGFSIMAMGMGMIVYYYLISDFFVEIMVWLIHLILGPFLWVYHTVRWIIHLFLMKVKKVVNFLLKRLKKLFRTVKIGVKKK